MQCLLSMGHILPPVRAQLISPVSDLKGLAKATYESYWPTCKLSSIVQFQEDQYTTKDRVPVDAEEWLWTHRMEAASWNLVRTRWSLRRYCEYPTLAILGCTNLILIYRQGHRKNTVQAMAVVKLYLSGQARHTLSERSSFTSIHNIRFQHSTQTIHKRSRKTAKA